MSAKHCPKHDITGAECWCCEEEAMSPEQREAAYQDHAFLAKRGGASSTQVQQSHAMHVLAQLSPEHLANLVELARQGDGAARRVIA